MITFFIFRQIQDEPNRLCRKASVAPEEAFIVEEVLLEDLCALSGEKALESGNIISYERFQKHFAIRGFNEKFEKFNKIAQDFSKSRKFLPQANNGYFFQRA